MTRVIEIANLNNLILRYEAGESELKLSREFGIDRGTIRRRLLSAGITPRNGSQANIASMGRMTFEQRQARTAASHIAARGRYHTIAEREMRAATRESKKLGVSLAETIFVDMLKGRGITNIVQQKAIGVYNVDIAIKSPRIAVEIYGGNWHTCESHAILHSKRTPYILNRGWSMVIIWVDGINYPLTVKAADYVAALVDAFRACEPARSQYRVIRGTGENVSILSSNFNCLAPVESPTSRDNMGRIHSNIR